VDTPSYALSFLSSILPPLPRHTQPSRRDSPPIALLFRHCSAQRGRDSGSSVFFPFADLALLPPTLTSRPSFFFCGNRGGIFPPRPTKSGEAGRFFSRQYGLFGGHAEVKPLCGFSAAVFPAPKCRGRIRCPSDLVPRRTPFFRQFARSFFVHFLFFLSELPSPHNDLPRFASAVVLRCSEATCSKPPAFFPSRSLARRVEMRTIMRRR